MQATDRHVALPERLQLDGAAFRDALAELLCAIERAWYQIAIAPVGTRIDLPPIGWRGFAPEGVTAPALGLVVTQAGIVADLDWRPAPAPEPQARQLLHGERDTFIGDGLVAASFVGGAGMTPAIFLRHTGPLRVVIAGDLGVGAVALVAERRGAWSPAYAPGEAGAPGEPLAWRGPVDLSLPAAWLAGADRVALAFTGDQAGAGCAYLIEELGGEAATSCPEELAA